MVIETDPRNPSHGGRRIQVLYKHRREIDRFFELSPDMQNRLPGAMRHLIGRKNVRVRVTYDQKTREILGKIVKARVADIDLHLPTCHMDCRLSVNLEMDWDGPVEELEHMAASRAGGERQPDRNKDRLSYTHGHYQIDLTQVTQQINGPGVCSPTSLIWVLTGGVEC
jgi:mRNA capping enzyme, beta chain